MPTVTPNMNLILPDVTVTVGPEWAADVNAALTTVDEHDHSSDNGKKVTPAGLDINADLDFQQQSAKNLYKAKLVNQPSALSGVSNACSVSFSGGDFYITNSGGVAVQVTAGNQVKSTTIIPPSPLMPAGTVLDFAGVTVPPGFLAADGSAVSRVTYSDLFTAIGTAYGIGDGTTTFNLPNFNGRVAVGSGTYSDSGTGGSVTRSLGQALGESVHTLTTPEMPSHTHIQNAHNHVQHGTARSVQTPGNSNADTIGGYAFDGTTTGDTVATNQSTGGGGSHNNMQPSLVINKIIKY